MTRNELQDKIVKAIVLMLLTLNPEETEYYRALLKHYESELNSGQCERELEKVSTSRP